MRAIILAAGIGSRLRPMTDVVPKTLVEVGGKAILGYQIDALVENGVEDIVVCTGYRSEAISQYCQERYPKIGITFVENVDFDKTNNMYSLYLAREYMGDELLLMNGDVCFGPPVIAALLDADGSSVAVDTSIYNEESMKIVVEGGRITDIAKTIGEDDAFGCSIDVYRFDQGDVETLRTELVRIIEAEKDLNQWTEVLLQRLFVEGSVASVPCEVGPRWVEIDNEDDLNQAEKLFNPKFAAIAERRIFFLDRDGTVSLGESPIEGASEFMELLRQREIPFFLMTNNSSRTPSEHHERMSYLPLQSDQLIVSTDAAIAYLKEAGIERLHLCATPRVSAYFEERGFVLTSEDPQAALLTYNNEITYAELSSFVGAIRGDLPYFATHVDVLYPCEDGYLPDIGTFIDMIEATTHRRPERTFGKPSPEMVKHVLSNHGLTLADAVIVGDRLYTDIATAKGNDMMSVLVLTGESDRVDVMRSQVKPDVIVSGLKDLSELFE